MKLPAIGVLFCSLLVGCGAQEGTTPPGSVLSVEVRDVAWAAYQDGEGAWQALPEGTFASSAAPTGRTLLEAPTHFTHPFSRLTVPVHRNPVPHLRQTGSQQTTEHNVNIGDAKGRYSLAYICLDEDLGYSSSSLSLTHSTVGADATQSLRCYNGGDEPTYTLSGTVRGLGPADLGVVYSFLDYTVLDTTNTAYSFDLWPNVYDIVATRYSGNATAPNRIILHQDVSLAANQTQDLDFESETAFTPETGKVTMTNVPEGLTLSGGVTFASENYTLASMGGVQDETTFDYAFIPPEVSGADADLYVHAFASSSPTTSVSVSRYLFAPEDVTLSLPEPLEGVSIVATQGSTPYRYPATTWNAYEGERVRYTLYYSQSSGTGPFVGAYVRIDDAWLPDAASYRYTLPDLSTAPGWASAWNLRAGEEISWYVGASLERYPAPDVTDYLELELFGTLP